MIKHVWFDFAGTLFKYSKEYEKIHDELKYKTYGQILGKKVDQRLIEDYEKLYKRYKTNSQVFIALGKHPDFWASTQSKIDKTKYIENLIDYRSLFDKIRGKEINISLYTNALSEEVLRIIPNLGLSKNDFNNLLTGEMVEKKPSLDGFYKLIKLSGVKPSEILYVGDRIEGEIVPANTVGLKTALVWKKNDNKKADFCLQDINAILQIL